MRYYQTFSRCFVYALLVVWLAGCALSSFSRKGEQHDLSFVVDQQTIELPNPLELYTDADLQLLPITLPDPIVPLNEKAEVRMTQQEIACMTQVMYREARGEGSIGMIAVGYAVLNRMATQGYADTVCGVVYQRGKDRSGITRCQFQWACTDLRHTAMLRSSEQHARELAIAVMRREVPNPIDDSIFFHEKSLKPPHVRGLPLRAIVANHAYFAGRRPPA